MTTTAGQVKPFAATLQEIDKGRVATDAGQQLHDLIEACLDTGKSGELVVKIRVKVLDADDRRMTVTGEVTSKVPRPDPRPAVFFADDDGNLTRTDPQQHQFDINPVQAVPAAIERNAQ